MNCPYSVTIHKNTAVPCGTFLDGNYYYCLNCIRRYNRRYPQGWARMPGDTCPHGVFTDYGTKCLDCKNNPVFLRVGDVLELYFLRNWRTATVLAVLDGEALVEYEMPGNASGRKTSALYVVARANPQQLIRPQSYRFVFPYWIHAMYCQGTTSWLGLSKRYPKPVPFPSEPKGVFDETNDLC